jgi:hypothetical protein
MNLHPEMDIVLRQNKVGGCAPPLQPIESCYEHFASE